MSNVFDTRPGKLLSLSQFQREWVETVANESIDNLDTADVISLVKGMEEYYGASNKEA